MRWLWTCLALGLVGCGSKPWIVGLYKDDMDWAAKDRVDTYEFKADGTWYRQTEFTHLGRPSSKMAGTYKLDGDKLILTILNVTSYRAGGEKNIPGHEVDTIKVSHNGNIVILDTENTWIGKTQIHRVK